MPRAGPQPNTPHPAIVSPPETLITWPVMNAASSKARKATAPGMSSGCPTRFIGIARTSASYTFLSRVAFAQKAAQDRRIGWARADLVDRHTGACELARKRLGERDDPAPLQAA